MFMDERLFLSAGFSYCQVGLARDEQWIYCQEKQGHIADQLAEVLQPCLNLCHFESLTIFLINGPGSTLGIRSLCAFIRTLLALKKVIPSQVCVCDTLHFAQKYLLMDNTVWTRPICARVNLSKILCLSADTSKIHLASEEEQRNCIWVEHPCLPVQAEKFMPKLEKILNILKPSEGWIFTGNPDVFQENPEFVVSN